VKRLRGVPKSGRLRTNQANCHTVSADRDYLSSPAKTGRPCPHPACVSKVALARTLTEVLLDKQAKQRSACPDRVRDPVFCLLAVRKEELQQVRSAMSMLAAPEWVEACEASVRWCISAVRRLHPLMCRRPTSSNGSATANCIKTGALREIRVSEKRGSSL
jgi:hypothetical protein